MSLRTKSSYLGDAVPATENSFPLDYGSIYFKMHRADADAEFIRCRVGVDKHKIVKHALDVWQLETPGVLLRVCGTTPHSKSGTLEHLARRALVLHGRRDDAPRAVGPRRRPERLHALLPSDERAAEAEAEARAGARRRAVVEEARAQSCVAAAGHAAGGRGAGHAPTGGAVLLCDERR